MKSSNSVLVVSIEESERVINYYNIDFQVEYLKWISPRCGTQQWCGCGPAAPHWGRPAVHRGTADKRDRHGPAAFGLWCGRNCLRADLVECKPCPSGQPVSFWWKLKSRDLLCVPGTGQMNGVLKNRNGPESLKLQQKKNRFVQINQTKVQRSQLSPSQHVPQQRLQRQDSISVTHPRPMVSGTLLPEDVPKPDQGKEPPTPPRAPGCPRRVSRWPPPPQPSGCGGSGSALPAGWPPSRAG